MATYTIDIHYDDFYARSHKINQVECDIINKFRIRNYNRQRATLIYFLGNSTGLNTNSCFYVSSKARALKIARSARATFAGAKIRGVKIRTYRVKGYK